MSDPSAHSSPTGYMRRRKTSRSVRFGETASRLLITGGGIATIVAVVGILGFLIWVVAPLFAGAEVEAAPVVSLPATSERPLRLAVDEYQVLGAQILPDGRLVVWRLDTGEVVEDRPVVEGARLTSAAFSIHDASCALGFADGTVRIGTFDFGGRVLAEDDVDPKLRTLPVGGRATHGRGVVERTVEGQLRLQQARLTLEDPVALGDAPIVLLAYAATSGGLVLAAMNERDVVSLYTVREKKNLLTGAVRRTVASSGLPYTPPASGERPRWLLLSGVGDTAYLAWPDGRLVRYDARDRDAPEIAETLDLAEEDGVQLTSVSWLLGQATLVVGDDRGRFRGWFVVKPEDAKTSDGGRLVPAHAWAQGSSPAAVSRASARTRLVALGFEDGSVVVVQATSEREVARVRVEPPLLALAIGPKDDALVALAPGRVHRWSFRPGHPEASFGALFGKVWYEGLPGPQHVWASTGADDYEPKLGLVPLVFGTLKATLYSMLFGVPLAMLAALFTSEFLHPRLRTPVKSTIEIMASLPSVVLGFLAALVIAPFVQGIVPSVLASFATLPFCFLLGAYAWQLLPQHLLLRMGGSVRFLAIAVVGLSSGLLLAAAMGPWIERNLFAGDFGEWLDRKRGDGTGGWLVFLLPFVAFACMYAMARWVNPALRAVSSRWGRTACALSDLARFVAGVGATLLVAWGLSAFLVQIGFDPRGSLLDTYQQKNALVCGFVMGFAIIPIIYTLAEDALTSVPRHLREASLGAGATPWQTAVRIIVPTAMSGLFSATMIGLGRAIGETMVVLAAAGNTPIMEWNPFNGFRPLSSNIAKEMPEAPPGSTHYRTLFLAALTLFTMTFVLNTIAERVRQRFRRRAFQL